MDSIATRLPDSKQLSGRRPRVLFVGNTTYDLPLSPGLARKWDGVSERLDLRIIGQAGAVEQDDRRFRLVRLARSLGGVFHLALPWVTVCELRRFRPDVVVTQSPYEAFAILPALRAARGDPKLIVEIHGDWRTAARLYGSRFRRPLAVASDLGAAMALRRADGTRAIGEFTAELAKEATGRGPLSTYPTYSDLESFVDRPPVPLPDKPVVAWIGALQQVKDPTTFAQAWRLAAAQVPEAEAIVVGDGPLRHVIDALRSEFPGRVRAFAQLPPSEVARVLDQSTALVLSSRSEGLGRVAIEAFTRGRPVIGTEVGGIRDIVRQDHSGLLVPPGAPGALADAIVRVLSDAALAERLAAGALADAERLQWLPERWADAVRELVDRALAPPDPGGGRP